jgi:peptidyl-prolyl cis-trans isomerase C
MKQQAKRFGGVSNLGRLALSLPLVAAMGIVMAQDLPEGSFALVNGQPLGATLLDVNVQANVQRGQSDTPQLRERLANELIGQEVLAQEAMKLKLEQTPQAQATFVQMQQNFLAGLLLEHFAQTNPPSQAQIKAQYERFLQEVAGAKQYKLSVITVADRTLANDLIAQLQSSDKEGLFAELAQAESIDNSAQNGGELDWLLASQMLPAIGNVVVNLPAGRLSAVPIQTRGGWNVVRVDEIRDYTPPPMEDIEPQLTQAASQLAWAEYAQGLRDKAKIVQ